MTRTADLELIQDELWALQALLKPITKDGDRPAIVEVEVTLDSTDKLMNLRQEVNRALLRFKDEPGLKSVQLSLSREQLWLIDLVITVEVAPWAKDLLFRVFRALDELDGLKVAEPAVSDGTSTATTPESVKRLLARD